MGAYRNSFTLLFDEEGEVDVMKLTEKAAEMEEMKKKKIQEEPAAPSWQSIRFPHETNNNAAAAEEEEEKEGGGEDWKVNESSRRRREGEKNKGGERESGSTAGTSVVNVEKGCESSEEEYEYEGLLVEEITKQKQKIRRFNTCKKKKAAAIRKLKGFDRH